MSPLTSSRVSTTSRTRQPTAHDSNRGTAGGRCTTKALLPTTRRKVSTSSSKERTSGPTASSTVLDEDRLEAVVPRAEHREHGEAAKHPRDIVDEDVLGAEDDRRPQDGVGEAGLGDGLLDEGLAAEVGKAGLGGGLGDAKVDDALDARTARRLEKDFRVAQSVGNREPRMVETNPVGVVKRRRAAQRFDEFIGLVEMKWRGRDRRAKYSRARRRIAQRPHEATALDQTSGDISARIAEGAGDDVNGLIAHGVVDPRIVFEILRAIVRGGAAKIKCEYQATRSLVDPAKSW